MKIALLVLLIPVISYSQKHEVRAFLGNTNINETGCNQFAPQIGISLAFKTYKSLYLGGSIKNEWITYKSEYSSYTSFGALVSLKANDYLYFTGSYDYMKNYTTRDEYNDLERKDLHKTSLSVGAQLKTKVAPFIEVGPSYINGSFAVQTKIGVRF